MLSLFRVFPPGLFVAALAALSLFCSEALGQHQQYTPPKSANPWVAINDCVLDHRCSTAAATYAAHVKEHDCPSLNATQRTVMTASKSPNRVKVVRESLDQGGQVVVTEETEDGFSFAVIVLVEIDFFSAPRRALNRFPLYEAEVGVIWSGNNGDFEFMDSINRPIMNCHTADLSDAEGIGRNLIITRGLASDAESIVFLAVEQQDFGDVKVMSFIFLPEAVSDTGYLLIVFDRETDHFTSVVIQEEFNLLPEAVVSARAEAATKHKRSPVSSGAIVNNYTEGDSGEMWSTSSIFGFLMLVGLTVAIVRHAKRQGLIGSRGSSSSSGVRGGGYQQDHDPQSQYEMKPVIKKHDDEDESQPLFSM
jgi:hypothetical protein